jgi:hypothetical protein
MTHESHISTKQKWWEWHNTNPHIYDLFERFALDAIELGHKSLSAWLIVNRIRWETAVVTFGDPFKISNNHIAYYARLFMVKHPQHDGFFKVKPLKYSDHKGERT